jgi:bacterial/archaeal transporter family protein
MHIAAWFWFTSIAILAWGITGLFQKLSTNHISAESTLILLTAGLLLLEPLVYPGSALLLYSRWNLLWGLLSGLMNALGAWALFAAMKLGGKASVVSPLTALYPLVLVLLAPLILRESITLLQVAGIICSLLAGVLFSIQPESDPQS